jgi:hypothetical protein
MQMAVGVFLPPEHCSAHMYHYWYRLLNGARHQTSLHKTLLHIILMCYSFIYRPLGVIKELLVWIYDYKVLNSKMCCFKCTYLKTLTHHAAGIGIWCCMWTQHSLCGIGISSHYLFSRSRVLLEKLIVAQLVSKLPKLLWNPKVHTVITRARHWSISWANWIRFTPSIFYFFKVHFNIILPPTHGSRQWSFPSCIPPKIL